MSDESHWGPVPAFAKYHTPLVRAYHDNPFIEALPPILERAAARELMTVFPDYQAEDRDLPPSAREHLASLVASIRQPTWLHGELYSRISRLMCNGYLSRNPISKNFQRSIDIQTQRLASLDSSKESSGGSGPRFNGSYQIGSSPGPKSNGLAFLGTSGIGKSIGIEMVLGLWPKVIVHKEYNGKTFSTVQIPWIKIDCPTDGNLIALAEKFCMALDDAHASVGLASNYCDTYVNGRLKEKHVPPRLARIAAQVGLGMLVIDEMQDLSPGRSRKLLSFLVQLVNSVGVPVVLVGGLDAFGLTTEQFRQARRSSTEGDLIVTQSERGALWGDFCRSIWKYQYTTDWVEMTPEHAEALFEVSQGITEFMVIAFKNAQVRAIDRGRPHVTPAIIKSVRDSLNLARPALAALRRDSAFVLGKLSDLSLPPGVESLPFLRGDRPSMPKTEAPFPGEAEPFVTSFPPSSAGIADAKPIQDEPRSAPRAKRPPQAAVPMPPAIPRQDPDEGTTLLDIVTRGQAAGRSPRESLAQAGFGDGKLWRTVIELPE